MVDIRNRTLTAEPDVDDLEWYGFVPAAPIPMDEELPTVEVDDATLLSDRILDQLDPCFNAGLMVFRPDPAYYGQIMKLWWETTEKHTGPTDQELLNDFYTDIANWKALPYAYNIRRFRPMRSFHFACCRPPRPWSADCRPSRKEAADFDGPILLLEDMVILFWKNFYVLLKKYRLEAWWRSTKFFSPTQEFGNLRYADCLNSKQLEKSGQTTKN